MARKYRVNYKRFSLFIIFLIAAIAAIVFIINAAYYRDINRTVTIEAGTAVPDATAFLKNPKEGAEYLTDVSEINVNQVNTTGIKIKTQDKTYNVSLKVVDTASPKAVLKEAFIGIQDKLKPEDFIAELEDATSVEVSFKKEPAFGKYGDSDVTVVMKDMGGNKIELTTKLHVSKVKKLVIIEAGNDLPDAKDFLTDQSKECAYKTEIGTIASTKPGSYDIELEADGELFNVILEIKDTVAPTAEVRALDIYETREVKPEEFVENIKDATDVRVTYKTAPDFKSTDSQSITLLLEDASGNKTEYPTKFRSSKVKEYIKLEASKKLPDIKSFLKDVKDAGKADFTEKTLTLGKVGVYPIKIKIGGKTYSSSLEVVDTIAPKGKAANQKGWLNTKLEPAAFVSEIIDETDVNVSFKAEPDYTVLGNQTVILILKDDAGNETQIEAMLTIEEDKEPPSIYGAKNTTAYIGSPISYKKGVHAVDNKDGQISVEVDSSNVNLKVPGEYKVIYKASDSSGNSSSKEIICTVKELTVTMDELNKLADEILAKITTKDMTLREKAWEIYQYVNKHLTYTGYSDKTDWMKEAHSGITKAVGDCFTYFSMSELFLNRIGMQTMRVERMTKPGETKHYWHLVNYGEGWYHFDACIHRPPLVSFMLTDAEMDAFSKRVGKDNYYYRFDKSIYPRTPEK